MLDSNGLARSSGELQRWANSNGIQNFCEESGLCRRGAVGACRCAAPVLHRLGRGRTADPVCRREAHRAGDAGRLFGSVTVGDIADAVKAAGGPDLDKRKIEIGNPIKTVGAHVVTVGLLPELSASITVDVVPA